MLSVEAIQDLQSLPDQVVTRLANGQDQMCPEGHELILETYRTWPLNWRERVIEHLSACPVCEKATDEASAAVARDAFIFEMKSIPGG
jgi:hypothetical protein